MFQSPRPTIMRARAWKLGHLKLPSATTSLFSCPVSCPYAIPPVDFEFQGGKNHIWLTLLTHFNPQRQVQFWRRPSKHREVILPRFSCIPTISPLGLRASEQHGLSPRDRCWQHTHVQPGQRSSSYQHHSLNNREDQPRTSAGATLEDMGKPSAGICFLGSRDLGASRR